MKHISKKLYTRKLALLAAGLLSFVGAQAAHAQITTVFYILLENRNWTENEGAGGQQILGNTAEAPYLNSLVTPNTANSAQVSYCSCYHNDLATYNGNNPSIHPSEPNYVWMEAGSNLSKADDNDPYGSGNSVPQIVNYLQANTNLSPENLSGLIQQAGLTWKSYSEGTNLLNTNGTNFNTAGGTLTNNPVLFGNWTVPLVSFSGNSTSYTNEYNHTHQYNFAAKHTGQLFFPATNGSSVNTANTSIQNVEANNYPPLEQLQNDLANNTCANYNVITPDQYNDMHTALSGTFTYNGHNFTGDSAQIAQGDNFCSIVVPEIMASPVYQAGHAAIILWTDETEGSNQNDFNHTLLEIAISPYCKGNAYDSTLNYTHSSDLATMQEIFGLTAATPTGYLNDAANYSNATPTGTVGLSQQVGSQYTTSTGTWNGAAGKFTGTAFTNAASPTGGFGTGGSLGSGQARDLSDLFVSGAFPTSLPGLSYTAGGFSFNRKTSAYSQTVTVTNTLNSAITNPVYLVVGNLQSNATLTNSAGTTVATDPGSPYVSVSPTGLAAGQSVTVTLQFSKTSGSIAYTADPINTATQP
jgi:hypothetical protein